MLSVEIEIEIKNIIKKTKTLGWRVLFTSRQKNIKKIKKNKKRLPLK